MRLPVLGCIGRGLADDVDEGDGDLRAAGKRAFHRNDNSHQGKRALNCTKGALGVDVVGLGKIFHDRASEIYHTRKLRRVGVVVFQIAVEDGQTLTDGVVHA